MPQSISKKSKTYAWITVEINAIRRKRGVLSAVDEEVVDSGSAFVEIRCLSHCVLQRPIDHGSIDSLILSLKLSENAKKAHSSDGTQTYGQIVARSN